MGINHRDQFCFCLRSVRVGASELQGVGDIEEVIPGLARDRAAKLESSCLALLPTFLILHPLYCLCCFLLFLLIRFGLLALLQYPGCICTCYVLGSNLYLSFLPLIFPIQLFLQEFNFPAYADCMSDGLLQLGLHPCPFSTLLFQHFFKFVDSLLQMPFASIVVGMEGKWWHHVGMPRDMVKRLVVVKHL